jgi:Uma2 family endonuclease
VILSAVCPPGLVVLPGVGVNISKFQHRVPDVAVVYAGSLQSFFQKTPPKLVVEVASARTRLYDRNRKKTSTRASASPRTGLPSRRGTVPS